MPNRPNYDNVQVPLGREVDILVSGYPIPLATEFVGDLQAEDGTYDVFGLETQLYDRTIDGGTLRLVAGGARESQALLDLCCGCRPDPSTVAVYAPNSKIRLDVIKMFRQADGKGYGAVEIYPAWAPVMTPSLRGGPRERGSYAVEGRCRTPVRIVAQSGQYITASFEVVNVGTGALNRTITATYGYSDNALQVPRSPGFAASGKHAITIEVQARKTSGQPVPRSEAISLKTARLTVTDAMMDNHGEITITPTDMLNTGINTGSVTDIFVIYLIQRATETGLVYSSTTAEPWSVMKGRLD